MSEPQRPLPRADEFDTREFGAGNERESFKYQQCNNCGATVLPRAVCTGCTSSTLIGKKPQAEQRCTPILWFARVITHSLGTWFLMLWRGWILRRAQILTNVVGVEDVSQVEIGMALELTWEEHEDLNILQFQPAS